jgi:hypothetical protein
LISFARTAINDFPGGGMFPQDFRAVQTLWSKEEMTLRVALPAHA